MPVYCFLSINAFFFANFDLISLGGSASCSSRMTFSFDIQRGTKHRDLLILLAHALPYGFSLLIGNGNLRSGAIAWLSYRSDSRFQFPKSIWNIPSYDLLAVCTGWHGISYLWIYFLSIIGDWYHAIPIILLLGRRRRRACVISSFRLLCIRTSLHHSQGPGHSPSCHGAFQGYSLQRAHQQSRLHSMSWRAHARYWRSYRSHSLIPKLNRSCQTGKI